MSKKIHFPLLFFILFILPYITIAQNDVIMTNATINIDGCINPSGTIYDNGGPTNDYSNSFNGIVNISVPSNVTITITGNYNTESGFDYITIYDNLDGSGTVLASFSGNGTLTSTTSSSGYLSILFHTDGSVVRSGFELYYTCSGISSNCNFPITNLSITNITHTSAQINWTSSSPSNYLIVNGDTSIVSGNSYALSGLAPGTVYFIDVSSVSDNLEPCCIAHQNFSTSCIPLTENDLPYVYSFEDSPSIGIHGTFNPCWSKVSTSDSPYPSNISAYSGSICAVFSGSSSLESIILPYYSDSLSKNKLSFYGQASSESTGVRVSVGITTNPSTLSDLVLLGSVRINNTSDYQRFDFSLADFNGHDGYVVIQVQTSVDLYLDHFILQPLPNCPSVYNLEHVNSVSGNVALNWSIDSIATAMPNYYDITATSLDDNTTLSFTVNAPPAILSGLTPVTLYNFTVTPICDSSHTGISDAISASTGCFGSALSSPIGTENSTVSSIPVNSSWGNTLCQSIYTASELIAAGVTPGNITSISYSWTPNSSHTKNFSIYMASTSTSNFTSYSYINTGHTLVYSGFHPLNTFGTVEYELNSPFYWDGTSNIVVTTLMNQPAGETHYSSGFYGLSSSNTNNMSLYSYRDSNPYTIADLSLSGNTSNYRPNVIFGSCNPTPSCTPPLAIISQVTDNSITINWIPGYNETSWTIRYRRDSENDWTTIASNYSGNSYTFTNLKPSTHYHFQIGSECDTSILYSTLNTVTLCTTPKFVYDDLFADYVTCYYGTFSNPTSQIGVSDYGSSSIDSRHTVHTNKDETDPRTGNALPTIPEGYCSSVRLGNWGTNAMAEAINYHIQVDTNDGDLLILKYAAVMEDPNHSETEQPKFTFAITDDNGNIINPCYNATFISNANLGWNTGSSYSILWKDWTTVGIDLSSMHGMNINVRLTTYDCDQGGHYGYAYFVLDLGNKSVRSNSCLAVENTFFAPLGFDYRWYSSTSDSTLSTTDSLHVTTEGTYYCDLSFVGAPNDSEHANCFFTISAFAGVRYPFARFAAIPLDSSSCTISRMRMINQSIVTRDPEHTDSIANGCESYLWVFDDSTTSTEVNPRHDFSVGAHSVTLYAMLANGQCVDSVTYSFIAGAQCIITDTIEQTICQGQTFVVCDSTLNQSGIYLIDTLLPGDTTLIHVVFLTVNNSITETFDVTACESYFWNRSNLEYTLSGEYTVQQTTNLGCDSISTLRLLIIPNYDTTIYDTICNGQSISFNNLTITEPGTTSITLYTATSPQCDSIVRLNLTVHEYIPTDTNAIECGQFSWYDSTYFDLGNYTHYLSRSHLNECDTLKTLHLTIHPTFSRTIYDTIFENELPYLFYGQTLYNDTIVNHQDFTYFGCDSITTLQLHIIRNSYASFESTFCENNLPLQWFHRIFYSSGIQYDTIVNHLGADSILTLTLHIIPTSRDTISHSICSNQSFLFEDSLYAPIEGFYTHHFTNIQGCDSLRTLALSVRQTSHGDTTASVCDQFSWRGQSFSTSDTFTIQNYTLNVAGCDSSVTLHLTIRNSSSSDITAEACDSISWFGTTFNQVPTYFPTHTLTNSVGCDSILRLVQLVIHSHDQRYAQDSICTNLLFSGYSWHDTVFYPGTTTGSYHFQRQNIHGCDSLIDLSLTVLDNTHSTFFDTIVENQAATHTFNNILFTNDTIATITIPNSNGCDSVITYNLHIWRNSTTVIDTFVCDNQLLSFSWYGHSYAAQIQHTLISTHGADSLLIINVHTIPSYESQIFDTICDNIEYYFFGSLYNIEGTYSHTLTATNGCDSLIHLNLFLNPTYSIHFYDSIYYGDTIHFEDSTYTAPGDYYHTYYSINGCDSIHILHIFGRLLVNDSRTDTICTGDTIIIGPWIVTSPGIYVDTILAHNISDPDTIMTYNIVQVPYLDATFDTSWVCGTYPHYILTPQNQAPYYLWSTTTSSDRYYSGHQNDSVIFAYPKEISTYTLTTDYRQNPLCPSSYSMVIEPLNEVFAHIETRPSELTAEQRDIIAFNRSRGNILQHEWYYWYNDDPARTTEDEQLSLTVPQYVDSLRIGLVVNSQQCTDTAYATIDIRQYNIFFPNVFTPTHTTNNRFYAVGNGINSFELWIYDRNGDLVFHTTDITEGWDGTHNGIICQQAAYVYRCRYSEEVNPRGSQSLTGTVLLLK